MSEKKPGEKSLQEIADDMRDRMIEYYRTNTVEEDARREAEADARVKAALEKLAREGKLPPRQSQKDE